jgi:predicted metal-dependent peptidase
MSALETARTRLSIEHPFIASAVMRMQWVDEPEVGTLAVDGRVGYYNAAWFDTLPIAQQLFCLAHEGLHVILEHCPMVRAWSNATVGPDGEPYDADRMNRAMDYLINGSLRKEEFVAPPLPNGGSICHDPRWDLNSDLIHVYTELGKNPPNPNQKPMDDHRPAEGEPLMDEADVKVAAQVHRATAGDGKAGKGSSIVEAVMTKFAMPDTSPWAILRDKIGRGSPTKTSWTRPHRHLLARGIVAPSHVSDVSEPLAIVVDISGSCHRHIPEFLSQMASIVVDAKPQSVLVLFVDDKVRDSWEESDVHEMVNGIGALKIPHGGATDMRVGIDYASDKLYSRVVVLTDGETPFPQPSSMEIIWALTRSDIKPPVGSTVYL